MVSSLALVSILAAPVAPPPAEATVAPAPAPAPAEVVVAPAPAPATIAEPSTTTVVVTTTTTTTSAPVVVQAPPPPPDVVVVSPPPPPIVSPPAPTWGPVRPSPVVVDPARTEQSIRKFRRSALGVFTVGGLGLAGAMGLQYVRARALQGCLDSGSGDSRACADANELEIGLGNYSAFGMAMFVGGTAGAGAMLGNAAATRDVQLRGGDVRRRSGMRFLGIVAIGASAAWMVGANYSLGRQESLCDGDPRCLARVRPLRWATNDVAALGIGAGAGLLGYAIAYERQGKALMTLRTAPSISARHTGLAVSMSF